MTVVAFCGRVRSDEAYRRVPRVLVAPRCADFDAVRQAYGEAFEVVPLSAFVDARRFVPMPSAVFGAFDRRWRELRAQGRHPIVVGLDGYLSLLGGARVGEVLNGVRHYVADEDGFQGAFVFRQSWPEMRSAWRHPDFWRHRFVELGGDGTALRSGFGCGCAFVDRALAPRLQPCQDSLKAYLQGLESWNPPPEGVVRIAVNFSGRKPFPGLSPDVRQYSSPREAFAAFCGFEGDVSEAAFDWIVQNTAGTQVAAELRQRFFPDGVQDVLFTVLRQAQAFEDDAEREVFLQVVVRALAPANSFLAAALASARARAETLLECYVNVSDDLLAHVRAGSWAVERLNGLRQLGTDKTEVQAALSAFIARTRDRAASEMAPWLNLETQAEEVEWVRRAFAGADAGERRLAQDRSELLKAYRSTPTENRHAVLNGYFAQYRACKCADAVTEEFCREAQRTSVPDGIAWRSAQLAPYRDDAQAALLVVDALGAEYVPFLVSRARAHRFASVRVDYARVRLPTSTPFNGVAQEWGRPARYRKFDGFDEALHASYGTVQEGVVAELRVLETEVMNEVGGLLRHYRRVVLTADHGATRLAVLAYRQRLSKDIREFDGRLEVEDWRYARRTTDAFLNSELVEETLTDGYVAVRGYNRFARPGGPGFEMHGGATVEEQVVPFLVFERAGRAPSAGRKKPSAASAAEPAALMTMNGDFDNL